MKRSTSIVLIVISSLSLITSTATLALMWRGSKKVSTEVVELKTKTNEQIRKLKNALSDLEI